MFIPFAGNARAYFKNTFRLNEAVRSVGSFLSNGCNLSKQKVVK
ncbi:hypothetical protein [Leptospira koniambonensis]|nr:hypothetical protein [Leptospira koniambonensis]